MTDKYESNGDYALYQETFKRKSSTDLGMDRERGQVCAETETDESKNNQKVAEYIRELLAEKILMDNVKLPNASRLVDQGNLIYSFQLLIFNLFIARNLQKWPKLSSWANLLKENINM